MVEEIKIESLSSEELALLLNEQYLQLMRMQNNINNINQILRNRQKEKQCKTTMENGL